jgi:LysR family glycine cleavage system transcriptional activator
MPLSRLPSLLSLRAFEAAARLGSIKEAANELAVTPGAVSQQIKSLEADLQVPLFVRKTRAIHLTPEGQRLQPTISEAFLQIRQSVDDVRPRKIPKLRISSTNALISKWLLPRLHKFTKSHPEMQVNIESEHHLDPGGHTPPEIEIRYAKAPPAERFAQLLHRELMLPVASPSFLEISGIRSAADITSTQLLYDTTPMLAGSLPSWDLWSKTAGLPNRFDANRAMRFERPPGGQIVDAAIAGAGIALCGSLLVYSALADGRLVCPFGPAVETGYSYFICCHPGREREEHIHEFMSWARQEAAVISTLNAMFEPSAGSDVSIEMGR